jgi:cyclopropane fatty-acyl-phospholipid synthase-like methyltransferase
MLSLAQVGPDDIFLDLGCSWGQNLIIALTEFSVEATIGFGRNAKWYRKAVKRFFGWKIASHNPEIAL